MLIQNMLAMKNNYVPRQSVLSTMMGVLALLLIVGCGTKKRVVHIERGVEVVKEERNIVSEDTSHSFDIDTSKIKTKTNERTYGSVVETWVWGKDGSPVSYTKETKGIKNTVTETDEIKGLSGGSNTTSQITDLSVLSSESSSEVIDDNLHRDNPPPVFWKGWWWVMIVGAAIVLGTMWFIARKF